MNILLIGSGGREHAILQKIADSPLATSIHCIPGNAGMCYPAEYKEKTIKCSSLNVENVAAISVYAKENSIDLTVCGPELPLSLGIADELLKIGIPVFGPKKEAAQLESSKVFAKEFLNRHQIPTGDWQAFDDYNEAVSFINKHDMPLVIKADGLAAGKGVAVATRKDDAVKAVNDCLVEKIFGSAGEKLIIEECFTGQELSLLCITDGKTIEPIELAQDYKRARDSDMGPNTGGMGSFSPTPFISKEFHTELVNQFLKPTIDGLEKDGIDYAGVIYAGIMLTDKGPQVLEYNVRFGDPETQAQLPRLKSDLLETMVSTAKGELKPGSLKWSNDSSVCVVLASAGYPVSYSEDVEIFGLDDGIFTDKNLFLYHAGTKTSDGKVLTSGGRVLNICATAPTFKMAREKVYRAVQKINFDGMQYRRDIAKKVSSA